MCNLVAFSTFTMLCNHHHYLVPGHFCHSKKETPYPLSVTPYSSLTSSPWQLLICFLFPILDISYKWNHIICGLWCLASFTQQNVFKVHPCCSMCQHLIIFNGEIIVCCMDIPHFVCPFISWWTFVLFHLLALTSSAAMNIFVQVVIWTPVLHFSND